MNKKGFELAISTIVILILGIFVVLGIIIAVSGGFKKFQRSTDPLLASAEGSAVKKACEIACSGEDKVTYCCRNQSISGTVLKCYDERLEIGCSLSCDGFVC